ncbi:MAG: 50S ribosomal protein L21 [Candidatus Dormibacteraceae bacterium]
MSEAVNPLSAVMVSGGKQHHVTPGRRILVDRMAAELGEQVVMEQVLMVSNGEQVRIQPSELTGCSVTAKVMAHPRGSKIQVMRFKSKKRVRVRRGARADLTELQILSIEG